MTMKGYEGAKVKIVTLDGTTEIILIKRRVKQSCSISLVLFNIWVNPLREKLNSKEFRRLRYHWNIEVVQMLSPIQMIYCSSLTHLKT
jgi:hypothetical protein